MKRETRKKLEYDQFYGLIEENQPIKLWYLAASVVVIVSAFLTLILI